MHYNTPLPPPPPPISSKSPLRLLYKPISQIISWMFATLPSRPQHETQARMAALAVIGACLIGVWAAAHAMAG